MWRMIFGGKWTVTDTIIISIVLGLPLGFALFPAVTMKIISGKKERRTATTQYAVVEKKSDRGP